MQAAKNLFDFDYEEVAQENTARETAGKLLILPSRHVATPQSNIEDRWYQRRAWAEIDRRLPVGAVRRDNKGEMLVAPVGAGKSLIAAIAIRKWLEAGERVLVLVDLDRLLTQMQDELIAQGIEPLIEKAERNALLQFGRPGMNCVLASMQTLYKKRMSHWSPDSFDKIVIDEVHCFHWRKITQFFASAAVLGLTATPMRSDGQSLKKYFHHPYIGTMTMRQGMEGWNADTQSYGDPVLARVTLETVPAPGIDLTKIMPVGGGGDFDQRELDKVIWENTNYIASAIVKHAGQRPTFVFTPAIPTTEAIAGAMRDMGARAAAYHSKLADPAATLKRFEEGDLQYLVSIGMLQKGVNVRKVSCIVRAKPSMFIGTATQEIGRGTRTHPESGKTDCKIVEFKCKTGEKTLASVIDAILDGADDADEKLTKKEKEYRQKVRQRASDILESGAESDVIRAADEAKAQLTAEERAAKEQASKERKEIAERKAEEKRAKHQQVEVRKSESYDPLSGLTKQARADDAPPAHAERATPEQVAELVKASNGVIHAQDAARLTPAMAEKRIRDLLIRKRYGYASEAQMKFMVNTLGCDAAAAKRMKKWDASKWIGNRRLEYVNDLCEKGHDPIVTNAKETWELAKLHKAVCGT